MSENTLISINIYSNTNTFTPKYGVQMYLNTNTPYMVAEVWAD